MKTKDTVTIAWCDDGKIDTEFAVNIMNLIKDNPKRVGSFYSVNGTGMLSKSRNTLVKHFLEDTKDNWLLMIDSDERISSKTFKLLCDTATADERPVVSGLVFIALWNGPNLRPVPSLLYSDENGDFKFYDNYPRNEVIRVAGAGTGCLLIHRSVLQKLRDFAGPDLHDWAWFQDGPVGGNRWLSEDIMFATLLKSNDIPMYAHTGAVLQHHKQFWLDEHHYLGWAVANQEGTGLEQITD
jgi:hypothetical protein